MGHLAPAMIARRGKSRSIVGISPFCVRPLPVSAMRRLAERLAGPGMSGPCVRSRADRAMKAAETRGAAP